VNLNENSADELNQLTSFPTARSNKNPKKKQKKTVGWAFKKPSFF